ncbi:MAG: 3-isopropylmalate dehydratase small subunit [Spirochaetes bacterium ADurb.Bin269]|nr:MAG: 3-isopropylmalate dehydratase small subunit [Spirochaetes bacterium ADurb.Bin269]
MKNFNGKVLFLDRSDINTDEIIPAKYLTEITKEALKPYCLEDLKVDGFDPARDIAGKTAIVTRANFGCGSSREHAPWALEVNGIQIVIAENFARIFRQNMYNCGMIATELKKEEIDEVFKTFAGLETDLTVDTKAGTLLFSAKGKDGSKLSRSYAFKLGEFEAALVASGGWVAYAAANY